MVYTDKNRHKQIIINIFLYICIHLSAKKYEDLDMGEPIKPYFSIQLIDTTAEMKFNVFSKIFRDFMILKIRVRFYFFFYMRLIVLYQ